jgi:regulator of sigma E protease
VISVILTVVGVGLLIAAHEAGHLALARLLGMRVEIYSLGFGPRIAGFKHGDTDYRVSAFPLGGYCKIAGFSPEEPAAQDPNDTGSYANKPAWKRFLVIAAGPGVNYLVAFLIIVLLYATQGFTDLSTTRIEVVPGGPAARAGLLTGDRIVSVDGVPIHTFDDLLRELHRPGVPEERTVGIERNSAPMEVRVHPENGRIQAGRDRVLIHVPLSEAVPRAFADVWQINLATLQAVASLFRGHVETLSGPIGIVKQASAEVKRGAGEFAMVLASLSVSLAVFNFLPIPALDGGRLVFLGIELVSRRRVNQRAETVVHVIGFLLLLCLFVAVTVFSDLGLGRKLFHRG